MALNDTLIYLRFYLINQITFRDQYSPYLVPKSARILMNIIILFIGDRIHLRMG